MQLGLEARARKDVAWLPLAPDDAVYPALSRDPAVQDMHAQLARLHLLGFIALYGPPPEGVTLQSVFTGLLGRAMQPAYIATATANRSPAASAWLEAFRYGLDSWRDVEFASPCLFLAADDKHPPTRLTVTLASPAGILGGACRRLARKGRTLELRRLASYLGEDFPDRFNPDHPTFIGATHPPQRGFSGGRP